MNYYDARQLESGPNAGKWHYTCRNDGRIWPVGNCAEGCQGHDTAEEACEHYRQYLLDRLRFLDDVENAPSLHRCDAPGCGAYTSGGVDVRGSLRFTLCAAHRNRETVALLYRKVGQIMSSF